MATANKHLISASAKIPASPADTYAIIANYRDEHRHILPPQFTNFIVEQGGIGSGTIIRFDLRILGKTQTLRAAISEPDPGHVLVETYLDNNRTVTTFIVDPAPAPEQCQVTISTDLPVRGGLLGRIERFLSKKALLPIYLAQLELLATRAATAHRSKA